MIQHTQIQPQIQPQKRQYSRLQYLLSRRALTLLCLLSCMLAPMSQATEQVPFGDNISSKIYNYHRQTPTIATSGTLAEGGMAELKAKGFKTILDLRTVKEGTQGEANTAAILDIRYINLPVDGSWPSAETQAQFKALVEDSSKQPLLIHCGSANRVGMVWAYYRIGEGIDQQVAILEGRTIGMRPSRERALLEQLEQLKK